MMAAAATTCCCWPRTTCLICSIQPCISSDFFRPGVAGEAEAAPGSTERGAGAIERVCTRLRGLMADQMAARRCFIEREGAEDGAGGTDAPGRPGVCGTCPAQPSS